MDHPHDQVDEVQADWARIRPELDTTPMAVGGRFRLAAAALARAAEVPVREEGLTRAEFDVLSAVRRSTGPLTPTGIAAATLASGAATTKRLDHLTTHGYLQRSPDPRDGRVSRLSITAQGRELVDRLLPRVLEAERAFAAVLPEDDRARLDRILRTLTTRDR